MPNLRHGMLAPGTVIGSRYSVVRPLGQGGMGAVYLAQALEHSQLPVELTAGTSVAIKQLLAPHLEEGGAAHRAFAAEARLLAGLRHPGLVRVHEQLKWRGDLYLVMQYLEGWSLSQLLRRRTVPLPFTRFRLLTEQLCHALSYLHTLDPPVIFRDLKPANIMVSRSGHITLIDFGIARVFDDESHTETGLRGVGSAGYAPPEQYSGGTDPRSDIYSLGATLYTLLTRKVPPSAALRVLGSEEITPIESLNPDVPASWCRAIRRMLQLRREERQASMTQVQADLFRNQEADDHTTQLLNPRTTSRPAALRRLSEPGRILFLTGHGMSAESGIPNFLEEENSWMVGATRYLPREMATARTFEGMPEEVWAWYLHRRAVCRSAQPNAAHRTLVDLERQLGDRFLLITQNVDGLHGWAGNSRERTYEIHGNLDYCRCSAECAPDCWLLGQGFEPFERNQKLSEVQVTRLRCRRCSAWARPHVLWLDESYTEKFHHSDSSRAAAARASAIVTISSAGVTNLPGQLARKVISRGGLLVDINRQPNPFSRLAQQAGGVWLRTDAADGLNQILEILK